MIPFQISFRNFPPSDAIWLDVQGHIEKLERFYRHIISCDVVISEPHRHHHQGKVPHIQIRLHVPEDHLIVNREPEKDRAHEDAYVAISDAFKSIGRQLEDYIRRRRRYVKEKEGPPHGFVCRIFPNEETGFIETLDGRELFFHKNSVLNNEFDKLKIGTEVRFSEEMGIKGPQVTSMSIVGREGHHLGYNPDHSVTP